MKVTTGILKNGAVDSVMQRHFQHKTLEPVHLLYVEDCKTKQGRADSGKTECVRNEISVKNQSK
jgi:hypothetical protein